VAVDGGPQLHQLAPEVVDVVGDQPNVLIIVGGSADAARRAAPLEDGKSAPRTTLNPADVGGAPPGAEADNGCR
jgi:hypothetical protein